jgi:hypothetical protein
MGITSTLNRNSFIHTKHTISMDTYYKPIGSEEVGYRLTLPKSVKKIYPVYRFELLDDETLTFTPVRT